jgi:hypothetical protein
MDRLVDSSAVCVGRGVSCSEHGAELYTVASVWFLVLWDFHRTYCHLEN